MWSVGEDETNSGPQAGEQKGREWGMGKKEEGEDKSKMGMPVCSGLEDLMGRKGGRLVAGTLPVEDRAAT